jgi:hypothetical protein
MNLNGFLFHSSTKVAEKLVGRKLKPKDLVEAKITINRKWFGLPF